MKRLIDADALITAVLKKAIDDAFLNGNTDMHKLLISVVAHQPTIDAVQVIRCKDCEDCTETKLYDGQRWNYCMRLRCVVKENDFCCWAERKYPKIKAKETE